MASRQIIVHLTAAELPAAEAVLWLAGALCLSLSDASDTPVLEPAPGASPVWPRVTLRALFPSSLEAETLTQALAALLPAGTVIAAAELADEDWQAAWRQQIRPRRFGRRLWLTPADEAPGSRGDVHVRLNMGLAFGTGAHPTTALCLEWLDAQPLAGTQLLDFGCGSGVLAIAGLALGAHRAFAVDNDGQALSACAENARLNGCGDSIWIGREADLPDASVDVLAANILAGALIDLAGTFAERVVRGGRIVLSGILADQADRVQAAFAGPFEAFARAQRDGWVRLSATRSADGPAGSAL